MAINVIIPTVSDTKQDIKIYPNDADGSKEKTTINFIPVDETKSNASIVFPEFPTLDK